MSLDCLGDVSTSLVLGQLWTGRCLEGKSATCTGDFHAVLLVLKLEWRSTLFFLFGNLFF